MVEVNRKLLRKTSFQYWEGSVRAFLGDTMVEETIPEAPRTSPFRRSRVPAEMPMRPPPRRPEIGVNVDASDMVYGVNVIRNG
jgi:hypothetical protein